jgi:putative protease
VFDAGHPEQEEEGGRIYQIQNSKLKAQQSGDEVALAFGRGAIDFGRVHPGDKVWKTSDPALERRLRQSLSGDAPRFQRPIAIQVHGRAGQTLTLIARDEFGHVVSIDSAVPLAPADTQPLTSERLREQLGRLGGTGFKLGELQNHLEGQVILPVSELNRLRREAVARLEMLRAQPKRWTLSEPVERPGAAPETIAPAPGAKPQQSLAELIVLVRSQTQLEAALRSGTETIYCEFEDPKKYRQAVATVRAWPSVQGGRQPSIFVAPPRIFKPGEEWILRLVRSCEADGFLLRGEISGGQLWRELKLLHQLGVTRGPMERPEREEW